MDMKGVNVLSAKIAPIFFVSALIVFANTYARTTEEQAMKLAADYFNEGKYSKAISELSKVFKANSKSLEAYAMRENIYRNTGEYDKAMADANKMIEIAPNLVVGYRARAYLYLESKEYNSAIADFGKAIKLAPELATGYVDRALAYLNKEDYDKAWEDVHKAQSLGCANIGFLDRLKGESDRNK